MVAQLDADFVETSARSFGFNGKSPPTGQSVTREQAGPEPLFFSGEIMVVDADSVDENVGLSDHGTDLAFVFGCGCRRRRR